MQRYCIKDSTRAKQLIRRLKIGRSTVLREPVCSAIFDRIIGLAMNTPHEFGPRLKVLRESRGITLEAIAESTKIGVPLLAGLERSDLSHWPPGIFRRAFVRDYAAAIGLPVDDTLDEFLRLFPDAGGAAGGPATPGALRMTLGPGPSPARAHGMRMGAALADAALVAVVGVAASWLLGVDLSTALAVAALVYYPICTGWFGRGMVQMWLQTAAPQPRVRASRAGVLAATVAREESRTDAHDGYAAGVERDRRTGIDRRRVPRVAREPESEPAAIADLFRVRKGSAA
jgi:hypothetical protein